MSAWKQILISLCVIVLGAFLWMWLYPGAAQILADHGLPDPLGRSGGATADAAVAPPPGAQGGPPGAGAGRGGGGGARTATVVVKPAGSGIINDRVSALGTGIARQTVTVLPQSAGTLTEVPVRSGAAVKAGDVLARLDSRSEQIAYDKARLAYDDARQTLDRNRQLVASNAAPASQTQAVALAAQVAELSLRSAAQDLAERTITAPISGVVGIVNASPGNEVTTQTVIATIVDDHQLLVNFWLPERLVGSVALDDAVTLVPVSHPEVSLTARVAAIDNAVDPASGTFQVQAVVDNAAGNLRPGMAFSVTMQFPGDTFVAVDPLAVQWGSQGAYVWQVVDGKAARAMVRIVQRNTESVLVAGDVAAGDAVVTEGIDGLKDGAAVQVAGAQRPDAAPKPGDDLQAAASARGGKPAADKAGVPAPASN
jgi:RND family efflux transporter MFP subunit